ncbi:hypothetical protein ACN47E_006838 [Coniothyrium glycines]
MDEPKLTSPIATVEVREGRVGNAFACERCRKHKVRCVPSDTASVCQRCQKARVECVEHVARRRPAKARNEGQTPYKSRDFDRKLDKLSAVAATIASSPTQAALPSASSIASGSTETSQQTQNVSTNAAQQPNSTLPVSQAPILPAPGPKPESTSKFWESFNDTLSCLGRLDPAIRSISLIRMQLLMDIYKTMVEYFPFVPLPKEGSCLDLVQHRPMLMFAVLTVASHDSVALQLTLSRELRKVIMVKIMNGEKSLDILQALIIFIAWHHHYTDPNAVSIPMLLQLALGIANDLGLDCIGKRVRQAPQKEDTWEREAKRAYVGCYFMACNVALLESGKSRALTHSDVLRKYAAELASAQEHRTDTIIPVMVDICHFMEDVDETFRDQPQQALVVRSQVKRLSDKWESVRLYSAMQANEFKTLLCSQLAARIQLYQTAASVEMRDRDSTPWASGYQLSLRVTCLRSIEQFLDAGTKLATSQFELVSLVNWLHLISTITNLGKLVQSSSLPGWDPVELQIVKTFGYFQDQLSAQMPQTRDLDVEDLFGRFRRTTATIKSVLHGGPGRGSPSNATFELATGSGRTVSLLHELPPLPSPLGMINGTEKLPSIWKINPTLDLSSNDFHWKFLLGTV